MVVRRTIHHLRRRPAEDRRAVAAAIAIGFGIILFFAWAIIFFRNMRNSIPVQTAAAEVSRELPAGQP